MPGRLRPIPAVEVPNLYIPLVQRPDHTRRVFLHRSGKIHTTTHVILRAVLARGLILGRRVPIAMPGSAPSRRCRPSRARRASWPRHRQAPDAKAPRLDRRHGQSVPSHLPVCGSLNATYAAAPRSCALNEDDSQGLNITISKMPRRAKRQAGSTSPREMFASELITLMFR